MSQITHNMQNLIQSKKDGLLYWDQNLFTMALKIDSHHDTNFVSTDFTWASSQYKDCLSKYGDFHYKDKTIETILSLYWESFYW